MGDDEIKNAVECYSGGSYAERPRAVVWQGKRLEVIAIEAEWREPDGKAFTVRTADSRRFELFYNETMDAWGIKEL